MFQFSETNLIQFEDVSLRSSEARIRNLFMTRSLCSRERWVGPLLVCACCFWPALHPMEQLVAHLHLLQRYVIFREKVRTALMSIDDVLDNIDTHNLNPQWTQRMSVTRETLVTLDRELTQMISFTFTNAQRVLENTTERWNWS